MKLELEQRDEEKKVLISRIKEDSKKYEFQSKSVQEMKKWIKDLESKLYHGQTEDDSDILGGLPTAKRQKIIDEVEELYLKNVELEGEN